MRTEVKEDIRVTLEMKDTVRKDLKLNFIEYPAIHTN